MLSLGVIPLSAALVFTPGIRINELIYDPPGTDGGHEFVELINTSSEPISLDGLSLVFVNGADPSRQRTVWRGGSELSLAPGVYHLIGEEFVAGYDDLATLSLQNGPDALWLMSGEKRLDAVAWGDVLDLGEGAPAADVAGTSLARVPDGHDSDDNASDFRALDAPTPGLTNSRRVRLRPIALQLIPEWRESEGEFRAAATLLLSGDDSLQTGVALWQLDGWRGAEQFVGGGRGDTLRLAWDFSATSGRHEIRLLIEVDQSVADSVAHEFQVGLGSLRLNEVMATPSSGEPEWIELYAEGLAGCDLAAHALADAVSAPRLIDASGGCHEGWILVSPDCPALRTRYEIDDVTCLPLVGGWPTLNNSGGAGGGAADLVRLYDASGVLIDLLEYGADPPVEVGHSLERAYFGRQLPAAWFLSPAPPTPGRANAVRGTTYDESGLTVGPNPFSPDGSGSEALLHIVFRSPLASVGARSEIRDLRGELVRDLGGGRGGGDVLQWIWDGRAGDGRLIPPGAYVVIVRSSQETAAGVWRSLVAVGAAP